MGLISVGFSYVISRLYKKLGDGANIWELWNHRLQEPDGFIF